MIKMSLKRFRSQCRTLFLCRIEITGVGSTFALNPTFLSLPSHRDHLLHYWFELLSTCPATTNMYDTPSFFRDSGLVQFLVELLETLVEFNITLEASLLKGISWLHCDWNITTCPSVNLAQLCCDVDRNQQTVVRYKELSFPTTIQRDGMRGIHLCGSVKWGASTGIRLDFPRALESDSGETRELLSRTATGNRAFFIMGEV